MAPSVDIAPEAFESPDAQRLIAALDEGLAALYPPEQRFGTNFKAHHAEEGRGTFIVARVEGSAAGCGALRMLDPTTAEVKRMYVLPELRGSGVARAILGHLEAKARALGATRLVLETGTLQLAAIRLYEHAGFRLTECWGEYAGVPTSLCYEKLLPDASGGQVWTSGDAYEPYVGRWSRRIAPLFLAWLAVPSGSRWLDIGCGTGALSQAILDRCSPLLVRGVDPSPAFSAHASERIVDPRARFEVGDAMALPFEAAEFDATVSGLVLNFVPDARDATAEMRRVSRPSGTVGAYVWDYAGEMLVIKHFWSAAAELDPAAQELDEGVRFNLCRPDELRRCFQESGLLGVEVTSLDTDCVFENFDDYWRPFLGGQAPAPAYLAGLGPAAQARLRERLRGRLPVAADGSISLRARAWAVKATVP